MNRAGAIKEARRRWGNDAAVDDAGPRRASSPEKRTAAREALMELRGFITTKEDQKFFREFKDTLFSEAMRMRFAVGRIGGVGGFQFFSVYGNGDTWADAFAQATRRNS